jgi:hypothetical protein
LGNSQNKTVTSKLLTWSTPNTLVGLFLELGERLLIGEKNFFSFRDRPVHAFETPSQALGLVVVVDERLSAGDPGVQSSFVEGAPYCFHAY